jgi:hypothetical protein
VTEAEQYHKTICEVIVSYFNTYPNLEKAATIYWLMANIIKQLRRRKANEKDGS